MEILRPNLPECLPAERLAASNGRVLLTGLVITRQRPGSASGVVFLTLEDETGTANVVVWKRVYEAFRAAVVAGRLLWVKGRIERDGQVTHLIAEAIEDLSARLSTIGYQLRIGAETERAGETVRPTRAAGRARSLLRAVQNGCNFTCATDLLDIERSRDGTSANEIS
ncbi:hypothetical protein EP867_14810 [Falsigemmobacter intermedius]|uniref:OB domain-containing protein n=2 Tax=Falsigemmobacter intermedius TaxID=1553448 RepID=A0A444M8W8_9RHOB|nr:hypothetical protein EP867_14810 [Falsigemmobacter intermedius]